MDNRKIESVRCTIDVALPAERAFALFTGRAAMRNAREDPTTQAGDFVHEEMEHVRRGKHGARSTKQAIATGLSKVREVRKPRR